MTGFARYSPDVLASARVVGAGWPHADQADIAAAWKRILASVRDYRDLEPALLGRVEELIDFTTTP